MLACREAIPFLFGSVPKQFVHRNDILYISFIKATNKKASK
jgi:hypothetical protein